MDDVTPRPRSPSELRFASLLVYSPTRTSPVARQSQQVVRQIKNCRASYIERIALRLRQHFDVGKFRDFLGPDVVLVPAPRRIPPKLKTPSWPAHAICQALHRQGLATSVELLLQRTKPVPKSALLRKGADRPGPEAHMESMRAEATLRPGCRITIVDDVVTRGATLLGCAWALRAALPNSKVLALAAVRTMSNVEIDEILAPIDHGLIQLRGGVPHRDP